MSLVLLENIITRISIAVSGKPLSIIIQDSQESIPAAPNEAEIDDIWFKIYQGKGR